MGTVGWGVKGVVANSGWWGNRDTRPGALFEEGGRDESSCEYEGEWYFPGRAADGTSSLNSGAAFARLQREKETIRRLSD